jgi:serine/threonine protein kinase
MLIANKYKIIEQINEGQFGLVVKGCNIRTNEYVAIKISKYSLKMEAKLHQYLGNIDGFPNLKWYGSINNYNYLVLDLYDYDLTQIPDKIKTDKIETDKIKTDKIEIETDKIKTDKIEIETDKIEIETDKIEIETDKIEIETDKIEIETDKIKTDKEANIKNIAIQMIQLIETLHNKLLIHRDIKPNNFMMKNNKLYLIDLGMCKRYETNGIHMKCGTLTKIIGTPNYVSLNIHNNIEPSRRDDIESILYICMYLFYGKLEWDNETNLHNIFLLKSKLTNLPFFLQELFTYVRQLEFDEKPNYKYILSKLLKD